jgi:hypothetical protein
VISDAEGFCLHDHIKDYLAPDSAGPQLSIRRFEVSIFGAPVRRVFGHQDIDELSAL